MTEYTKWQREVEARLDQQNIDVNEACIRITALEEKFNKHFPVLNKEAHRAFMDALDALDEPTGDEIERLREKGGD